MIYLPSTYGELFTAPEDLYAYPELREGMVFGWWPPDRSGLNVFDLSGRGNHGTLVNGPTWVATPYGYALDFVSASSQYSNTFEMRLQLENGAWKIIASDSYWVWCWDDEEGCN